MSERPLNFGAGPTTLPEPVLRAAQRDLVSLPAVGVSPLEASHRSGWFEGVIEEPEANLRELLQIPSSHHVVSCQGGATMQFSMAPMNLLRGSRRPAEYVVTGSWGRKAAAEARKEGDVRVAWDGEEGVRARAGTGDLDLSPEAAYVHVTSNETTCSGRSPRACPRCSATARTLSTGRCTTRRPSSRSGS